MLSATRAAGAWFWLAAAAAVAGAGCFPSPATGLEPGSAAGGADGSGGSGTGGAAPAGTGGATVAGTGGRGSGGGGAAAGTGGTAPGTGGRGTTVGTGGTAPGTGGSGSGGRAPAGTGGATAAGTGGSWAGPACTGAPAYANLISDFASDPPSLIMQGGRSGGWYFYGDPAGTVMPPQPPMQLWTGAVQPAGGSPCSSGSALHMKGTGFSVWGAGAGFNFGYDNANRRVIAYDASAFNGVGMWARSGNGGALMHVAIVVSTTDTDVWGPTPPCSYDAKPYCNSYQSGEMLVSNEWTQLRVTFSDPNFLPNPSLADSQPRTPFYKDRLTSVSIKINAIGSGMPNDFDLWIDDAYFF